MSPQQIEVTMSKKTNKDETVRAEVTQTPEKPPEPEKPKARVYSYLAKENHTLIIQGTTFAMTREPDGSYVQVPAQKPIKLAFSPVFRLTPEFAKSHNIDIELLRKMIEDHSQFRDGDFKLITEEETIPTKKGPAIVTGARGTGAL